jgi:sigma-54 dependent transcriptional regulator, acetoin dehydrogenase operon transcriptional activator AcoR
VPFDPDVDGDGMLVRAARPVLEQLSLDLNGAPVTVVLTNEQGHVLDRRVSDASLSGRLDRILFAHGFVYAEDLVRTNAIGTALAQRRPAAVDGEEHFVDALITFACAAAPIADPRSRRVLGVIDLTSLLRETSALMLPLATRGGARDRAKPVRPGRNFGDASAAAVPPGEAEGQGPARPHHPAHDDHERRR